MEISVFTIRGGNRLPMEAVGTRDGARLGWCRWVSWRTVSWSLLNLSLLSHQPMVPVSMRDLMSPAGGKNDVWSFWLTKTRLRWGLWSVPSSVLGHIIVFRDANVWDHKVSLVPSRTWWATCYVITPHSCTSGPTFLGTQLCFELKRPENQALE